MKKSIAISLLLTACAGTGSPGPGLSVDDLTERGRALLDERRPVEAEALLQQAAELDGGTLRTRMWVLRSWMDQQRSNDVLDALDALRRDDADGPTMDYLYGMAFARRAEGHIAAGVTDSSVEMNFSDAVHSLTKAVEAEPDGFRDAYLPLARAAWFGQDLDRADAAIERAVELFPSDGETHLMRGKIAFSHFRAGIDPQANDPAAWDEETLAQWTRARDGFRDAVELLGAPVDDPRRQGLLIDAAIQLGHTLIWKGMKDEAAGAYGTAIAWAPDTTDYGMIRSLLAPGELGLPHRAFHEALLAGAAGFEEHSTPEDTRDATLRWWLGYSHFSLAEYDAAEQCYVTTLEKSPGFVNAWYYLGLVRFSAADYPASVDAFVAGWNAEPAAILQEVERDAANTVPKLEYLIGVCAGEERLLDAAVLAEICAEAVPDEARHWNNMGLFLRDEGARLTRELLVLLNRSYDAYSRALELAPEDPQILNDTALILHYYLGRDLERARELYLLAAAAAEQGLAAPNLSPADRERYETALKDAQKNLERLEKGDVDPEAADAEDAAAEAAAAGSEPTEPEPNAGAAEE